jgi:cell wall assembly regulator SMI1/predicted DNA-binding WGR domain protein
MPARELHFVEGKSAKFWRVEVKGARQIVTYGRMGTAGVSKTKEFPSASAARTSAEKLISEKLGKGYVEAGKGKKAPPAKAPARKGSALSVQAAVDKAWAKAEKQLLALGQLDRLAKGASATAIRKAEKRLGVSFPEDFRASYARHDGADYASLLEGREFLSLESIFKQWKIWKELHDDGTFEDNEGDPDDPGIKEDWWNPKWIPFTHDASGNHHCIDLDPERGGKYGQVISMWHDDSSRTLVARSFTEFIAKARWGEEDL